MIARAAALLIGGEVDCTALVIRVEKGGENPTADTKIGTAVVRLFDSVLEAERYSPESGWCHAPMMGASPTLSTNCRDTVYGVTAISLWHVTSRSTRH